MHWQSHIVSMVLLVVQAWVSQGHVNSHNQWLLVLCRYFLVSFGPNFMKSEAYILLYYLSLVYLHTYF